MVEKFETILALDSAMNGCGVGVYQKHANKSLTLCETMMRGQAEALIPMVQEALEKAELGYEQLNAIVTTIGPGAFTGLRIGISAAKALALALEIPVFGVTTLQALALAYVEKEAPTQPFGILIETKRADFYVQHFDDSGAPVSESAALSCTDICKTLTCDGPYLFIGDALERFSVLVKEEGGAPVRSFEYRSGYSLPDPGVLARLFSQKDAQTRSIIFTAEPLPLYLRGADVSVSKKKFRKLENISCSLLSS